MKITISIPFWLRHHNRQLYSALYFCEKERVELKVLRHDETGVWNGIGEGPILMVNGKTAYLDVSDDSVFDTTPSLYDFYFKRSLLNITAPNVYPMGFHQVFTYKPISLIRKMSLKVLTHPRSAVELIRATDFTERLTNQSHFTRDYRNLKLNRDDHQGRVIFYTRLWDPDLVIDVEEKKRRMIQNEFRIGACRIIRENFKNSTVGLFPDVIAKRLAPDLLMNEKDQSTPRYFQQLRVADIGIADDGLKDTPGAKIGEYVFFRKCVITTPINTLIHDFKEGVNYLSTRNRSDYQSIPELIESCISNKRYLEIIEMNDIWSKKHLDPYNYFKSILDIMGV